MFKLMVEKIIAILRWKYSINGYISMGVYWMFWVYAISVLAHLFLKAGDNLHAAFENITGLDKHKISP